MRVSSFAMVIGKAPDPKYTRVCLSRVAAELARADLRAIPKTAGQPGGYTGTPRTGSNPNCKSNSFNLWIGCPPGF